MVDPSPSTIAAFGAKATLRRRFRTARTDHVAALPERMRALVLNRPPAQALELMPPGAVVGLYYPTGSEAPALGWARWLAEHGRQVALPWFAAREAPMQFRLWRNPWDEDLLEPGPWQAPQPLRDAAILVPATVVVPLLAFTADGHRLGQGGGHYDRWLAAHPHARAIGLAWDCQLADALPTEDHDRRLDAVVTPSRFYGIAP